jgi:hypothetical protein
MDQLFVNKGTMVLCGSIATSLLALLLALALPISIDTPFEAPPSDDLVETHGRFVRGPAVEASIYMAALVERPLFYKSRRPQLATAPELVAIEEMPMADRSIFEGRDLVGVIESESGPKLLLAADLPSQVIILKRGDQLGDWRFDHLEGRVAVFVAGDEAFHMTLKERSQGSDKTAIAHRNSSNVKRRKGRP